MDLTTLVTISIAVQAAASLAILRELRKPRPQSDAPVPSSPTPETSFAPAAVPVDEGIWELLHKKHGGWVHVAWVREGSLRWESGKRIGFALRDRGGSLHEGTCEQ